MSGNGHRWGSILAHNGMLRSRVATWKSLLLQLTESQNAPDPRLIPTIRLVQQFLERDVRLGFAVEEDGLYADTEDLHRGLVIQLRREHEALRRHLESIDRRLHDGTALANPDQVRTLGVEFAEALRAHMRRDEQELIPLAKGRYRMVIQETVGGNHVTGENS